MSLTLQKVSQFHLIFWCENFVERHSFWRVSGNLVFMVFFAVWYMDISIFCAQNSFRRLDLQSSYMLNYFKYFLIYMEQNVPKIRPGIFWTTLSIYVLNYFKYFIIHFVGQMSQEIRKENYIKSSYIIFWVKMARYWQRFLNYNSQYFQIVYTLTAFLSKNSFYFFFLIIWHGKT